MVPTIGCHSTIDKPECVRRVMPPTTTIAKTSAQHTSSHCGHLPAVAGCIECCAVRVRTID
jgi:hypothetical protein